ncbi:MAG TPA: hypothetical protein PKE55_01315 [Kiritimatiellia bacterium]|nr:hypothetical protein [Kiritimatiellia bacterium]
MTPLALLPVHGMGSTQPSYAEPLRKRLRRELGPAPRANITFEPIYYQDIIQDHQERVWRDMNQNARLSWKRARRFMLYAFSDAASLEHQSHRPDSAYILAQERIRDTLHNLLHRGLPPSTPTVLLPYSLGCQVLSNYIWDANKDQGIWALKPLDEPPEVLDFLKFRTLRLILSTGCNIPLFVAGLKTIRPISRPHPKFRWLNFYDKDDVLGWPLKPLSPGYDRLVEQDIPVNSGNLFTAWTPFSHTGYWTNSTFLRHTARALHNLTS